MPLRQARRPHVTMSDDIFDRDETTRVAELSTLIRRYQDSYYNGEAEIHDEEFDRLWDELKTLDPDNPLLRRIGADSGNFAKARHIMPMGSQEKAADTEQFYEWARTHDYSEYLVEYKLDGASLELQYRHGALVRAVTRGDGSIGDDITANARKMQGVQATLFDRAGSRLDFTGGVRGEVIMTHDVHQAHFAGKANCRNAANGLMRRKDGEGSEYLRLIVYDALATEGASPFDDEVAKINWLRTVGFMTVPLHIAASAQDVVAYRAEVMELRGALEYDIDGLVVKARAIDREDAARTRPDRQIAFKFSLEEAVTTVRAVEWSESGATYTPVAVFDAVQLAGTTVQRASLANPFTMRKLGLRIGSRVVVVKRGEIIPKIESVLAEETGQATTDVPVPTVCAACGAALVDDGTRLYCPSAACPKRVLHRLKKWASVIDIRDLGEALITALFDTGRVRTISDLYTLTVGELAPYFLQEEALSRQKDSLGAQKVYDSIQAHRSVTLAALVAGFDIEGIGETTAQKLVEAGFDTLEKLLTATPEELSTVYGFADIMATTCVRGLRENADELRTLVASGAVYVREGGVAGSLAGASFCFTGELRTMKRADAESLVRRAGGSCKSSVTKDLSYLVTNDTESGSSKNAKAAKYGVRIIDEAAFLALVGAPAAGQAALS